MKVILRAFSDLLQSQILEIEERQDYTIFIKQNTGFPFNGEDISSKPIQFTYATFRFEGKSISINNENIRIFQLLPIKGV